MRWIPISKKYPNEAGMYLVTIETPCGLREVGTLSFRLEGRTRKPTFYNPYNTTPINVIAWMPIPGPYYSEEDIKARKK